jgi:hypothetical protein
MKLRNHIKDTRSKYSIFDHIIQLLIYYVHKYMEFSEMSIYIHTRTP